MAITTAPENWSPTWENNIEVARRPRRPASSSCCRSAGGAATAASRISRASRSRRSRGPPACSPTRAGSQCSARSTRPSSTPSSRRSRWRRSTCFPRGASRSTSSAAGTRTSSTCSARTARARRALRVRAGVARRRADDLAEDEPVGFEGRFFQLNRLIGRPKPSGDSEPVLMNAGYSPAGRAFAMRNCEFLPPR